MRTLPFFRSVAVASLRAVCMLPVATNLSGGTGVGVGLGEGLGEGVGLGEGLGLGEGVGEGVAVGLATAVALGLGASDTAGLGLAVELAQPATPAHSRMATKQPIELEARRRWARSWPVRP